jgi:hypothetical protein
MIAPDWLYAIPRNDGPSSRSGLQAKNGANDLIQAISTRAWLDALDSAAAGLFDSVAAGVDLVFHSFEVEATAWA